MTPEDLFATHQPHLPAFSLIWTAVVDIAPREDLGETPQGRRFIVPILGGRVFAGPGGEGLSGEVLPGGADTRGMVGAPQLDALGAGWLVNVGRGSTVDEDAVVTALTDGALRGAALDVVATEPLPAGSPLWDVPGLLLTGHSAALSPRWGSAWAGLFEANLAAARGERGWTSRVVPPVP